MAAGRWSATTTKHQLRAAHARNVAQAASRTWLLLSRSYI